MISKNTDFGVRGNVKFLTEANLILSIRNCLLIICIQITLIYGTVFEIKMNIWRKVALCENRINKPKIEISLSHLPTIRDIQNYLQIYVFEDDKYDEICSKKLRITKDVKIQDGRQLWLKNVLGMKSTNYYYSFLLCGLFAFIMYMVMYGGYEWESAWPLAYAWIACLSEFSRRQLFVIHLYISQKPLHISTWFECR